MTAADLKIHAQVIRRAIERHRATPDPNPIVLMMLEMIEQEYEGAHEWAVPNAPEEVVNAEAPQE